MSVGDVEIVGKALLVHGDGSAARDGLLSLVRGDLSRDSASSTYLCRVSRRVVYGT